MKLPLFKALTLLLLSTLLVESLFSQARNEATNPNYRLSARDRISINVFDEPELAIAQGIDARGEIRLPLIGAFKIEGMTIREVEEMLESQYIEQKILRNPIVSLDVLTYSTKEVSVLGAVPRPGQIPFPPEIEKIDIVEVISMVGGFTPLSKKKDVKVTRTLPNGSQILLSVNVEEMIEGKKKNKQTETTYIYPGDLIFVDEIWL